MAVQDKVKKNPNTDWSHFIPILVLFGIIPVTLLLWFGNIILLDIRYRKGDEIEEIPPTRWLASVIVPLIMAAVGLHKRSVSKSGAVAGLVVGFILTLSSYCFIACIATFFLTSSKATKFRSEKKKKIEEEFKEGGQRNWIQVICNGGMATFLAFLYLLDYGCGELAINFTSNYRASWLSIGVLGAVACSNGDTWASELGTVLGGDPFLITTLKKVPRGTNGGVSFGGLIFSLLGGIVIGVAHYLTIIYFADAKLLALSPPQWPLIVIGGFAGFVGSFVDSILGATVQFSGVDKISGYIVEHPGDEVVHVSGFRLLDNHSVNLLSSVLMGYFTPVLANIIWP